MTLRYRRPRRSSPRTPTRRLLDIESCSVATQDADFNGRFAEEVRIVFPFFRRTGIRRGSPGARRINKEFRITEQVTYCPADNGAERESSAEFTGLPQPLSNPKLLSGPPFVGFAVLFLTRSGLPPGVISKCLPIDLISWMSYFLPFYEQTCRLFLRFLEDRVIS